MKFLGISRWLLVILAMNMVNCKREPPYPYSRPIAAGNLSAMRAFATGAALALDDGDIAVTDLIGESGNVTLSANLEFLFPPNSYLSDFLGGDPEYFRFVDGVAVDVWGQPYRIDLFQREGRQELLIESSGPDGIWDGKHGDDLRFSVRLRKHYSAQQN